MSPHSFFIIVLRIIGIFSFKTAIIGLFQSLATIFAYGAMSDDSSIVFLITQVIVIGGYFAVSWVLVFRAAYIVDRFDLSKDISPVLQFRLDKREALRIALVVTGAILLATEIPAFIADLAGVFEEKTSEIYNVERNWRPVIMSGVKVLIGLLIIGERNRILDILLTNDRNDIDQRNPEQPADQPENKDLFPGGI